MVHSTTFPSLLALFAAHFFQLLCKYNCTVRSDDSCPKLFFSKEKEKIYIISLVTRFFSRFYFKNIIVRLGSHGS